jgi:hypothetical protein
MKSLKPFAAVIVVVAIMILVHPGLSRAQEGDNAERLRQLEQEMEHMRQELDKLKTAHLESPLTLPERLHLKFQGSVTIRYDLTSVDDPEELLLDGTENGFRTRVRFGVVFQPDGPVNAGIRLTTGEDPNPTSPFIPMGDIFRSESWSIDRFYIDLRPGKFFDKRPFAEHRLQATFLAGKYQNPFWSGSRGAWRSEIIWDTDVQPAGVSLKLAMPKLTSAVGLESTTSYYIIEEVRDFRFEGLTGDTFMVATQLKADIPFATFAFAYYTYQHLNAGLRAPVVDPGSAFVLPGQSAFLLRPGLQRTNNTITLGQNAQGFVSETFNVIDFAGQLYFPLPLPALNPEIWLHGEYLNNLSVDTDDQGFSITLGLRGGGQGSILAPFNLWFTYRNVDNDATLGTFADSDLCAGTGCKGFEFGINYHFHRNFLAQIVVVDFDGFPDKDNHVTRAFFDLVAHF